MLLEDGEPKLEAEFIGIQAAQVGQCAIDIAAEQVVRDAAQPDEVLRPVH